MTKKIIFFVTLLVASFYTKAQTVDYLSEEKISQILEKSRKKGVKEWEVQKQNKILHQQLKKQNEAIANGTFLQKTVLPPLHVNSSVCFNAGFENDTTLGWSLFSGNVAAPVTVNLPCDTCANTLGAITKIVNSSSTIAGQCTNGVDKYGNFPVVAPTPSGGSYSLLLNDSTAGGKIEQAQYTFVVDNSVNIFTFQYAVVLQSGGHQANAQPYFSVSVTDLSANSIIPCTIYEQSAPPSGNIAGWSMSTVDPTVYTKNWTSVNLDLQSVIGHTVTVKFTVSDCNLGGHFGYCYIDAACGNINYTNIITFPGICDTMGATTISAPGGYYNYQWFGPHNSTPILYDTLQTMTTTAHVNDTFIVKANSALGCPISLSYIMKSASINIYSSADSINLGDTVLLSATGAISYTWTSSDGGSYSGDSIYVTPIANTTYTVVGADSSGCTNTASKLIKVVSSATAINKYSIANNISVYPNPANEMLYIECPLKNATLFITDILGNKIKQISVENELTTMDISSLSKGVYFLSVKTVNNVITKRFIVQR
ncbi:MAG TPA: T9SS type A sorting domain-containing protein [Bacteroidia bacterium]|nr:T9SS type A sorting domain-containing protein [Bacteroidia bacterium]